jgi:hypothetical protein
MKQPHVPLLLQHWGPITHIGHVDGMQPPDPDPLDELELLADAQAPPLQVCCGCDIVQSAQAIPPVPHVVSAWLVWQKLFMSQQPAQVTLVHPPLDPASSMTPLLLLPLPASSDPLELEPPPLLDLLMVDGKVSPTAHDMATSPVTIATSFPAPLHPRSSILQSVRGAAH